MINPSQCHIGLEDVKDIFHTIINSFKNHSCLAPRGIVGVTTMSCMSVSTLSALTYEHLNNSSSNISLKTKPERITSPVPGRLRWAPRTGTKLETKKNPTWDQGLQAGGVSHR